jgi:hypothetical protein
VHHIPVDFADRPRARTSKGLCQVERGRKIVHDVVEYLAKNGPQGMNVKPVGCGRYRISLHAFG